MKEAKRLRLQAKGWRLTSPEEILDLTQEEVVLIETKLAIDDAVSSGGVNDKSLAHKDRDEPSRG